MQFPHSLWRRKNVKKHSKISALRVYGVCAEKINIALRLLHVVNASAQTP